MDTRSAVEEESFRQESYVCHNIPAHLGMNSFFFLIEHQGTLKRVKTKHLVVRYRESVTNSLYEAQILSGLT